MHTCSALKRSTGIPVGFEKGLQSARVPQGSCLFRMCCCSVRRRVLGFERSVQGLGLSVWCLFRFEALGFWDQGGCEIRFGVAFEFLVVL